MTESLSASQRRGTAPAHPAPPIWRAVVRNLLQAVVVFCLLMSVYLALPWLRVAFDKPINRVIIKGDFQALSEQSIRDAVVIYDTDTFLTISLDELVRRLEQQPWIDYARVRRVWPDTLEIALVEQHPIAYWGDAAMVNAKGRIFEHKGLYQGRALPRLWSELGSPAETMNYYEVFRQQLEPVQLRLQSISQTVQGDWRLQLENGLVVILDRTDPVENARRFLTVYERLLVNSERKPEVVDMRYQHGAAIRWQPLPETDDKPVTPPPAQNKAVQHEAAHYLAIPTYAGVETSSVEVRTA